jgi:hypothetical protein
VKQIAQLFQLVHVQACAGANLMSRSRLIGRNLGLFELNESCVDYLLTDGRKYNADLVFFLANYFTYSPRPAGWDVAPTYRTLTPYCFGLSIH